MDHQAFLVWLNEIDDLSSKQRAETGRLVAGVSSLESVIDLLEANVREGRVWTPLGTQAESFGDFGKCGRVPTCVRPLVATLLAAGPYG